MFYVAASTSLLLSLVGAASPHCSQERPTASPPATELADLLNKETSIACAKLPARIQGYHLATNASSVDLHDCQSALASIVHSCILDGKFYGGAFIIHDDLYNLTNRDYPDSPIASKHGHQVTSEATNPGHESRSQKHSPTKVLKHGSKASKEPSPTPSKADHPPKKQETHRPPMTSHSTPLPSDPGISSKSEPQVSGTHTFAGKHPQSVHRTSKPTASPLTSEKPGSPTIKAAPHPKSSTSVNSHAPLDASVAHSLAAANVAINNLRNDNGSITLKKAAKKAIDDAEQAVALAALAWLLPLLVAAAAQAAAVVDGTAAIDALFGAWTAVEGAAGSPSAKPPQNPPKEPSKNKQPEQSPKEPSRKSQPTSLASEARASTRTSIGVSSSAVPSSTSATSQVAAACSPYVYPLDDPSGEVNGNLGRRSRIRRGNDLDSDRFDVERRGSSTKTYQALNGCPFPFNMQVKQPPYRSFAQFQNYEKPLVRLGQGGAVGRIVDEVDRWFIADRCTGSPPGFRWYRSDTVPDGSKQTLDHVCT